MNSSFIWFQFLILLVLFIIAMITLKALDNRKKYYLNSKFFLKDYVKKYVVILIVERSSERYIIYETKSSLFFLLSPGDRISKKQLKEIRGL